MATIELIEKLYNNGELRKLIECGLITVNVLSWRKVYNTHHHLIREGYPKHKSKELTAEIHNMSERSVYRILTFLNYEPQEKPTNSNGPE
jgi:predicted RNA-binding protein